MLLLCLEAGDANEMYANFLSALGREGTANLLNYMIQLIPVMCTSNKRILPMVVRTTPPISMYKGSIVPFHL